MEAWQREQQRQRSPVELQQVVEEYRQAQARIAQEEQVFSERHPDYRESVKRLKPGNETPIPPTSYYHLMLNVKNPVDVAYRLSRHPQIIAKLWSLESSGKGPRAIQELNDLSAGLKFAGSTPAQGPHSSKPAIADHATPAPPHSQKDHRPPPRMTG